MERRKIVWISRDAFVEPTREVIEPVKALFREKPQLGGNLPAPRFIDRLHFGGYTMAVRVNNQIQSGTRFINGLSRYEKIIGGLALISLTGTLVNFIKAFRSPKKRF